MKYPNPIRTTNSSIKKGKEFARGQLMKAVTNGFGHPDNEKACALKSGEFRITRKWHMDIPLNAGRILKTGVKEFIQYMRRCRKINLKSSGPGPAIIVKLAPDEAELKKLPNPERSHRIETTPLNITITAVTEKGAVAGLYYLAKLMDLKRAPVLISFEEARYPLRHTRITHGCFGRPYEDAVNQKNHPDKYLARMAYYGLTDFFLYINLFEFSQSKLIPELSAQRATEHFNALDSLVKRARRYGLGIYLHINTPCLAADSPALLRHPEIKGAQSATYGYFCLCSSSPLVKRYYTEVIVNLFRRVPDLQGVCFIVGGECFMHCFSRPYPLLPGTTNCPRCHRRNPNKVVADMVNPIVHSVKKKNPSAKVVVWPYGSQHWSLESAEQGLLKRLSSRATWLSCFEKIGLDTAIDGHKYVVGDYSITHLGPTPRFCEHNRITHMRNMEHWVKTESSTTAQCWIAPYIPTMFRWAERFKRIAESGVAGSWESWFHYGFTGSRTEEIADWMSWSPAPEKDWIIRAVAERDFGKANADRIIRAWKHFDKAFEFLPYAVRGNYMNSWFAGPSHPFLLDPREAEQLKEKFSVEIASGGGVATFGKKGRPRSIATFCTDTATEITGACSSETTDGMSVSDALKTLKLFIMNWGKGMRIVEAASKKLNGNRKESAKLELGVSRTLYHTAITTINLLRFDNLRKKLWMSYQQEKLRTRPKIASRMLASVLAEKNNAGEFLRYARKDRRLGWGCEFGPSCTPELVQAKLEHLESVIGKLRDLVKRQE